MIRVYVTTDGDGHNFVIPYELKEEFSKMLDEGEKDEWESFTDKFGKYMTGGSINLVALYADV